MIYKIQKTNFKNEYVVNDVIRIRFVEDGKNYAIEDIYYENNILSRAEAYSLADELKIKLNLTF